MEQKLLQETDVIKYQICKKQFIILNDMKQYFIIENDQQLGPFTIDELKTKKLRKSTSLWTDGMKEWTLAESIDELKEFIIPDPPPYINRPSSVKDNTLQVDSIPEQQSFQIGNEFLSSSRGLLLGTIGVILFSVLNWVDISFFGFSLRFNLFSLYKVLNRVC